MVYVCRKEHFSAAHRLYNADWSGATNAARFGICSNPNGHGHNFTLITKVGGLPDPETGCVIDLKVLGQLIREHIIAAVDGKYLNEEVPFLAGKIPSCEVIVMAFWDILYPLIQEASGGRAVLHKLELYETAKNFVEYSGPRPHETHPA
ncbi:MAG: 6-pyruvoyl tetrahydropterin synthase family protein [Bernardetiaceae bacterium]